MILFFYGPNDYLLKQKLGELKVKYKTASKGSFDLVTLEGADLTFEKFLAQVQTVALFATTRLVIVNQIFDASKEVQDKIKENLAGIGQSSVVVFVQAGEPDKRLGLFKALNKPKISQYFKKLEKGEASNFVLREAKERGAIFAAGSAEYLVQLVGDDPWQLASEIEKLALYKDGDPISQTDIDKLVSANVFSNTFDLVDAIVLKNKQQALKQVEAVLAVGEPPLKVLGAIHFQVRLMALVKDELLRGTPAQSLAAKLKVNPYPLRKTLPLDKRYSWQDLHELYRGLISLDEKIKTGKIVPEEALKELVLNL